VRAWLTLRSGGLLTIPPDFFEEGIDFFDDGDGSGDIVGKLFEIMALEFLAFGVVPVGFGFAGANDEFFEGAGEISGAS